MADFNRPIHVLPDNIYTSSIYFGWEQDTVGFGQLSITKLDDGKYSIDTENMGLEWTRRALHAFVDTLVDDIKKAQNGTASTGPRPSKR